MDERGRRVTIWLERAALGAMMTVVAVVVERRLLRVIRRRGEEPRQATANDAELSAAPKDVDH